MHSINSYVEMAKEKSIDFTVAKMLESVQIPFEYQECSIVEVTKALKTASKKGTGKQGFPEFVAKSGDFLIIIENKNNIAKHVCFADEQNNIVSFDTLSVTGYAVNGAVHYALHIAQQTSYKKIFAFGVSGDDKHHKIQPLFIHNNTYKFLTEVETFENFSVKNINDYYREQVLGETPKEQIELQDIIAQAKTLHEDLWKYGALRDTEKPLVVSAILLALEDENFTIDSLIASQTQNDGQKILQALENYLNTVKVEPEDKKNAILYNFAFIKNSKQLNEKYQQLDKTPLRHFTEFIQNNIKSAISYTHSEDVLGRFYSEFVKYGGGDGQGLGIVLTPRHITELFCDLLDIKTDDIIFDPCCGTAGFLITAMHRMMKNATPIQKQNIRKKQLYGIEIKDDLFTVATTNMILRGDGQSNLRRLDFLQQDTEQLQTYGATVGMMNPPYSQSKGKDTRHLSELNFIYKLLSSMAKGARVAVIVPQSAMIGKTADDRQIKQRIYNQHTIKSVITLNKDTFYGVGVNPCIAIFTAQTPHNQQNRVKFFNFEDDGYTVSKHIGLVETERAKDRRRKLLDCYFDRDDAPTRFLVKTTIEPDDEWLHSFYYFNDEIPTPQDFEKTMADYLTFQFNMITHGRGYLFETQNTNQQ